MNPFSTMLSIFASAITMVLLSSSSAQGVISVISDLSNQTVAVIKDQPARFMPDQDAYYDLEGYLVYAKPANACEAVEPPPFLPSPDKPYPRWILLAQRYDCNFQTKIENAQNASYYAIIVHNVGSNSTEAMGVEDPSSIDIFAVFVGEYDGQLLRDNFKYNQGYHIRIQDDFSYSGYLLPFAIVVGACFIVMLLFMVRLLWQQVMRWIRERRRNRKRRLPASALKKLPTQKWTKGDPYETCAICIEDFVVHDKIRVLPCSHGFHTDCIDPWLTKGRRVCPICKRKVVLAEERFSDSDSDSDSETAPLLGASTSTAPTANSGSTFVQQRENPFRRAQRRMRIRPHQRPIVIPDTDSSSDSDDGEYDSSSDPSHAVESSGSHTSIVAEVHVPNKISAPCRLDVESDRVCSNADPEQEASTSQVPSVADVPTQELRIESDQVRPKDTGPPASQGPVVKGRKNRRNAGGDPVVVNITTSCNSQDFSDVTPESSTSFSASSSSSNLVAGPSIEGDGDASSQAPMKPGNAIV